MNLAWCLWSQLCYLECGYLKVNRACGIPRFVSHLSLSCDIIWFHGVNRSGQSFIPTSGRRHGGFLFYIQSMLFTQTIVAGLKQRDRRAFTLTVTPMDNLEPLRIPQSDFFHLIRCHHSGKVGVKQTQREEET